MLIKVHAVTCRGTLYCTLNGHLQCLDRCRKSQQATGCNTCATLAIHLRKMGKVSSKCHPNRRDKSRQLDKNSFLDDLDKLVKHPVFLIVLKYLHCRTFEQFISICIYLFAYTTVKCSEFNVYPDMLLLLNPTKTSSWLKYQLPTWYRWMKSHNSIKYFTYTGETAHISTRIGYCVQFYMGYNGYNE